MQAYIFCLVFPLLPLLCYRSYQENKEMRGRELIIRYGVYALITQVLVTMAMVVLCDPGTSFMAKVDTSPSFTLKFALVELVAAVMVAFAEWMYVAKRLKVRLVGKEYQEMGISKFLGKYIFPYMLYFVAVAVVLLNVSLLFDNVLWGDECFSANTARKSVNGILQVLYFWDNHPPLHYYWTKLFGELFGHTGPVYHLAAVTPFFIEIGMALTFLRKRFGKIPAAFFIIITGIASSCIRYNLEIRMYSLAFLGVICCYYCAYRVVSGGKLAWFMMVFWALVGAYSHYYAMMAAGILIFVTGVATAVRFKGKTWIKSVLALIAYIVGYAPWFKYLFRGTSNVSNNWWMTEIMGLSEGMKMLLCGVEFEKIVLVLLVVFLAAMFLTESSFFEVKKGEGSAEVLIHRPLLRNWSDETYGAAIGVLSIIGTLIATYLLCLVVGPVLTGRYLYPVSAITVLLLTISCGGARNLVDKLAQKLQKNWLKQAMTCGLLIVLAVMFVIGLKNYKAYRSEVMAEKVVTEQALGIIGEVDEDTALISNNVKHLAWTVLYYYYPKRDIVTGSCDGEGEDYSKFWYFTPEPISKKMEQRMLDRGYSVEKYGAQQIASYPFELYYFEKMD